MNKILLTGIVSALFLICSSSSSVFAEENPSPEHMDPITEMGSPLEVLIAIAHWITALGTIILALALFKTFHHLETSTKMSKIETEYRLRPWVGPVNSIKALPPNGQTNQYDCTIKNYGELPAQYVTAYCKIDTKLMDRNVFKSNPGKTFNLGPLLPNMEKHYWVFIDSSLIKKAKDGSEKIFSALYFEYPVLGGKSGYGMISEYNPQNDGFIHKEMWVESPNDLPQ
jgi:hypothetical protein